MEVDHMRYYVQKSLLETLINKGEDTMDLAFIY